MIHMRICPVCGTIQKAGTNCGICKYPIEDLAVIKTGCTPGRTRKSVMPVSRVEAAAKPRNRKALACGGD